MSKKKREGRVVSLPVSTAQAVAGKSADNGQLTSRESDSTLERDLCCCFKFPHLRIED